MGAVNERADPVCPEVCSSRRFPPVVRIHRPSACADRPFPPTVRIHRTSSQESAMADLAFVVTVLAGFALVALVAKGVTKL